MNTLDLLKQKMLSIVNQCLRKHGGGESYFDELDGLIKQDSELMLSYLQYAVNVEGIKNIVISGEIGQIISKLISEKNISLNANLILINGGLRKGKIAYGKNIPVAQDFKAIFLDDSLYSGKTARAVENFIRNYNGTIVKKYVFYDGCRDRHDDVVSLYQYY